MDTMQLMELFKHYSGRLQVHEANAGAASSAVAGSTSWSCNRNPDELAYYGQHKAQQATERALEDLEQPPGGSEGTDLLPSGSPPVRLLEMMDMMDIIPHGCNSIVLTAVGSGGARRGWPTRSSTSWSRARVGLKTAVLRGRMCY